MLLAASTSSSISRVFFFVFNFAFFVSLCSAEFESPTESFRFVDDVGGLMDRSDWVVGLRIRAEMLVWRSGIILVSTESQQACASIAVNAFALRHNLLVVLDEETLHARASFRAVPDTVSYVALVPAS